MANIYDVGDGVRLSATFTVSGTGTNTTATLSLRDPSGNVSNPSATSDGTGAYHADVILDEIGAWYYRWVGTGAVIAATEEHLFVRKRKADE